MAKGASKGNGRSGGGTAQSLQPMASNQVGSNPLMRNTVESLNSTGRWTQNYRATVASNIKSATETGDKLVFTANNGNTITFTKKGTNKWVDNVGPKNQATMTDGELVGVMADISGIGGSGKWSFKPKKK